MIKKLWLENWKTHRKSEFEFGPGTNVIVGIVGSGKSSIVDAVCFALYGTFPALNVKRLSQEEVITSKPNEMQEAIVRLVFEYAGDEYEVERTIRQKGANDAKLWKEERLIAGPKTTDVTKKVEEITEVSYDLFSRAVYSEQNQIDYFMRLSPAQRKEKFDELLQINRYEKGRANAVKLANLLRSAAAEKKKLLERQREAIKESEMLDAEKRIREKESEITELNEKERKLAWEIDSLQGEIKGLEASEQKFKAMKELLIKSMARLESIEKAVEETKRELAGKSAAKIREEQEKAWAEMKAAAENLEKIAKERKGLEGKANDLMQKAKLRECKIAELQDSLEQLEQAEALCPVCRRSLKPETKKELLERNGAEQKKIIEEKEALLRENEAFEKQLEEAVKKENFLSGKIEKMREETFTLKGLVERSQRIEKQLEETGNLRKEICAMEDGLEKSGFDENVLGKKRETLAGYRAGRDALKRDREARQELVTEIKQGLERMEKVKAQLRELEIEIGNTEKMAEKTALFVNALKATQSELRLLLINTINEAMHDIWGRIYPYGDYVSVKIEIVDGDYEIMAREQSGKWRRVDGILSGGERSAAALTIRIAVSLVLTQNLSWLIIDEPTHNLDAESIEKLSTMMKTRLPGLVEQIFIITHEPLMENAASSSIYLLERDKAADGPTKAVVETIK